MELPELAHLLELSSRTAESGGPRDYDADKKVISRRRQVLFDTDGRGLILEPQPADI